MCSAVRAHFGQMMSSFGRTLMWCSHVHDGTVRRTDPADGLVSDDVSGVCPSNVDLNVCDHVTPGMRQVHWCISKAYPVQAMQHQALCACRQVTPMWPPYVMVTMMSAWRNKSDLNLWIFLIFLQVLFHTLTPKTRVLSELKTSRW